jgi:UDP-2,3-diacylglucosamine hydrolase
MLAFCSDIHLCDFREDHPFALFLQRLPSDLQGLFILGDLFESWWGDDHQNNDYHQWESILRTRKYPIYFLPGNRDFLCDYHFYSRNKISPLISGSTINYAGKNIILYHGDEPGLQDTPYQVLRVCIRQPAIKKLLMRFPEAYRAGLAHNMRSKLKGSPYKSLTIEYDRWFKENTDILIHGHIHHHKIVHHLKQQCLILGSWDNDYYSFYLLGQDGNIYSGHDTNFNQISSLIDTVHANECTSS